MSEHEIPENTKILVVDDMPTIRNRLIELLNRLGLNNIMEANNGIEAWKIISKESEKNDPFQIIFLDIRMAAAESQEGDQIGDGIELLKRIRNSRSHSRVPIIMVSTENQTSTILDCVDEGASDYIVKPFNYTTIKEKIISVLCQQN